MERLSLIIFSVMLCVNQARRLPETGMSLAVMVATLAKAASADYYVRSQASYRPATEYMTATSDPDAFWWNPSDLFNNFAPTISNEGIVDSAHFYRLYKGFHPVTGDPLTKNAGSDKRCPGYDLTFNADKTVSALWAISPPDLRARIERSHNDAVRVALHDTIKQHCAYTRIRPTPAAAITIVPADIIAALYQHGSARSPDPHLHTRSLILNVAHTHHDGKWRALHGAPLFRWVKAAGAAYRAELAWLLRERLGIQTEPHGKDQAYTRITGMPEKLIVNWSKRQAQINKTAARIDPSLLDNPHARARIRRKTTEPLERGLDPETRHAAWTIDALEFIPDIDSFLDTILNQARYPSPRQLLQTREALDSVPTQLTSPGLPIRYPEIVQKTSNAALGHLSREDRKKALQHVLHDHQLIQIEPKRHDPQARGLLAHMWIWS